MPPLAKSNITIRDYPSGLNIITFSVDPVSYDPFSVAKRGSSHKVLSGRQVHQDFGVQEADFIISMQSELTEYAVTQDIFTKYRTVGGQFELRDWFVNRFVVVFALGQEGFKPVPIRGSCTSFEFNLTFRVIDVLQWFSVPF